MLSAIIGLVSFCITIYGIYLGFKAHPLLGILLIVPPFGFVIGIVKVVFKLDGAEEFMKWWRAYK